MSEEQVRRSAMIDRSQFTSPMSLEKKLEIIKRWDSGVDSNLSQLARHFGLQRGQVSRVLCTRMNYVEHRGRPIVVAGDGARHVRPLPIGGAR